MSQPVVSAVVLSFNSARYIEKCVRSLCAAGAGVGGVEVFVVENGSRDGSVGILQGLEREFPDVLKCIYLPTNTGTTVSRNLALRQATAEYIVVLDSDAVASEAALRGLIDAINNEPDCGLVVPGLTYPDGRFQLSTDAFPTVTRKLQRLFALRSLERGSSLADARRGDVDYAISAFWLFRRSLLAEVGLLDERIFYSPEDVDFCLRIWLAGYRIVYVPRVVAIHDAQEVSRSLKRWRFMLRHAGGLAYYFAKHRYAFGLGRLRRRIAAARQARTADPALAVAGAAPATRRSRS
jgi:GT2 family glycosyltransferase